MTDIITIDLPPNSNGHQWSSIAMLGLDPDGDVVINQGGRLPIYIPSQSIPALIEALSRFVPEPTNVAKLRRQS